MYRPFIIGITGGSASGKTLFLDKLLNTFHPNQVCLISQDNYYKARTSSQWMIRDSIILIHPIQLILNNMLMTYGEFRGENCFQTGIYF